MMKTAKARAALPRSTKAPKADDARWAAVQARSQAFDGKASKNPMLRLKVESDFHDAIPAGSEMLRPNPLFVYGPDRDCSRCRA